MHHHFGVAYTIFGKTLSNKLTLLAQVIVHLFYELYKIFFVNSFQIQIHFRYIDGSIFYTVLFTMYIVYTETICCLFVRFTKDDFRFKLVIPYTSSQRNAIHT